ncbi:MAG: PQQ-binding-like beta-propeller repeat protein, partial [Planctomycetota bacterium]
MIALLAAATLVAARASAQQVRPVAPVGAIAPAATTAAGATAPQGDDDVGVAVDMFENPQLDRYLRAAQRFLDREDYDGAVRLLQEVIEGRISEVVATGPEEEQPKPDATPAAPVPAETPKVEQREEAVQRLLANRAQPGKPAGPVEPPPDARNAVFSHDGRLYRPVSRLCHEMLARMPAVGIEIYRATHEVAAEELLQAALRDGSLSALERVVNHYFVTLPGGKAMALLADRLMHEGRYRAAVLVLGDLLSTYPAELRKRLAISEVWCQFKAALCLRLAGEQGAAHEAVAAMATKYAADSLRVLGELHAVKDLPADELFARDVAAVLAAGTAADPADWLADPANALVPLWQFRFRNPEPYKDPKASNNNERNIVFFNEGVVTSTMPHASRYGPATWVAFRADGVSGRPEALFLEHFRLRTSDATTGVLLAQGDGNDEPPVAREGHPRIRIAASDHALLRPVDDGERRYVVTGHPRATTTSVDAMKTSVLVAYERAARENGTQNRVWSSDQWLDGDGGLRDVTFLAAPTVFGERLLLPALRRGKYTLECVDRRSGRPAWHVPLHAGGSPFFKAPGCPVVVQAGVAWVATNAGCVAAVDAFTGDLRWIRRYERTDPRRKATRSKRTTRNDDFGMRAQFGGEELPGFLPNDLIVVDGLVVVAACDSDMLLCLDGATGQPQWMFDATTRYAPYGRLRTLVGRSGDDLFATSDTHLVAIGLAGGLVKWARELPAWNGPKNSMRGRGAVTGRLVVIPGERELIVYGTDGTLLRRAPVPAFDPSRDPLAGSANVVVDGARLALGYQGGVEVFSARPA